MAKKEIKMHETYKIYTDGASKGNPGPASVGYIVFDHKGVKVYSNALILTDGTNNMAEYYGVIFGLKSAINLGIKKIRVYCDSELVVNQINGKYKVSNKEMRTYCEEVKVLSKELSEFEISWVPRGENLKANQLAQEIMTRIKGCKTEVGTKEEVSNQGLDVKERGSEMEVERKEDLGHGKSISKSGVKQQKLNEFFVSVKGSKPDQNEDEMIEKKSSKDEHEQLQGVGNFTRREDTEVKIGQVDGKVERRHAGDAEAQDKSTGQQSRCAVSVPYI